MKNMTIQRMTSNEFRSLAPKIKYILNRSNLIVVSQETLRLSGYLFIAFSGLEVLTIPLAGAEAVCYVLIRSHLSFERD
jgi:hypothetical protein